MTKKPSNLQKAFEWFFDLFKQEAGEALVGSVIEAIPKHISEQFSD